MLRIASIHAGFHASCKIPSNRNSEDRGDEDRTRAPVKRFARVIEMLNRMRVFFLTIFFVDSIQRTNCDDVMSQCSMTNGKGE